MATTRQVKARPVTRRRGPAGGFTLIELLVVIAIIGILATITFPAVTAVRRKSKVQQARTEAHEIANAITEFYHEYRKLPLPEELAWHETTDKTIAEPSVAAAVYAILTAKFSRYAENPKRKVFLKREIPEGEVLRDPWGQQYWISLDTEYDGDLTVNYMYYKIGSGGDPEEHWDDDFRIYSRLAVVRSLGPNGRWDRVARGIGDDIVTYYND